MHAHHAHAGPHIGAVLLPLPSLWKISEQLKKPSNQRGKLLQQQLQLQMQCGKRQKQQHVNC